MEVGMRTVVSLSYLQKASQASGSARLVNERNRLWLLKKSVIGVCASLHYRCNRVFLSPPLSGSFPSSRFYWLAEEAHEPLNILRRCGQQELFPHELQSPQTQATQSDLILQFREQGFYFLPLPLCLGKLRRVR
jgi:hypothetical protein